MLLRTNAVPVSALLLTPHITDHVRRTCLQYILIFNAQNGKKNTNKTNDQIEWEFKKFVSLNLIDTHSQREADGLESF